MKNTLHHSILAVALLFSVTLLAQNSKQTLGVKMLQTAYEKHNDQLFEGNVFEHVVSPYAHDPIYKKVDVGI